MKSVGIKLEEWAFHDPEEVNKDLFGRSAFNRYYYAAFLVTREMLGDIDNSWKATPHKNIPVLLESKSFKNPVNVQLKKNLKRNFINTSQLSSTKNKLINATTDLANLLKNAYDARIIADYEPDTKIIIEGNILKLHRYNLNSAKSWEDQASAYCKIIRQIYRSVGIDN